MVFLSSCAAHYSIPTDNVLMNKIVGTGSGRIFMLGDDKAMYVFRIYSLDYVISIFIVCTAARMLPVDASFHSILVT
jgi:hypothetical protein